MSPSTAIRVAGLTKVYDKGAQALRGVSFEVEDGAIFSLLGRNGSGKTTTVRILTGLTAPTAGDVEVLGHAITVDRAKVQARIGVTLQEAAIDEVLTGREFLVFVASIVGLRRRVARERTDELLTLFGLSGSADRRIGSYSGGMKRRVDLAAALIRRPEILFLDEPTTGLDPQSRRALWAEINRLQDAGTTVFLTTQYLEEAEALADVIAVIDDGSMLDVSDPDTLRARYGRTRLRLRVSSDAHQAIRDVVANGFEVEPGGRVTIGLDDPDQAISLLSALRVRGVAPADFEIRRDSLEDVFLRLTGAAPDAAATDSVSAAS